ncbi:hypothetical protein ACOMHN_009439 [Nucella lapillus]
MADNRPVRQPKDLKGLLKFCVENTKDEDPTTASREMSPERKAWLTEAMDTMPGDPTQEVRRLLGVVGVFLGGAAPSPQDRDRALGSLEDIFDWCESIDIAMDFVKIGGFSILHELLTNSDPEFRAQGFRLVGVLVQNNPRCQEAAVTEDLLPTMLTVLRAEQDPEVQCQAVQALSCLVRDSEVQSARELFASHGGFEALTGVLQTPGPFRRVVKVAFLLGVLCANHPHYKDAVCEAGLVELLVGELQQGEHQQSHEHLVAALLRLATDHPPTQALLTQPHLGLDPFLRARLDLLAGKEENEEERSYAEQLLHIMQTSASS